MAANYSSTIAADPRIEAALFNNREGVDSAYDWLLKNGYNPDEIHLLMSEEMRQKYHYPDEPELQATEDNTVKALETGAAVGGGLGATLGAIAAVGAAVIIPGLGIAVAGPLAASLAGAGGMVGGALGALYGASIPEERARAIEGRIKEGSILVGVLPHNDEEAALIEAAWRNSGGEIVHH